MGGAGGADGGADDAAAADAADKTPVPERKLPTQDSEVRPGRSRTRHVIEDSQPNDIAPPEATAAVASVPTDAQPAPASAEAAEAPAHVCLPTIFKYDFLLFLF